VSVTFKVDAGLGHVIRMSVFPSRELREVEVERNKRRNLKKITLYLYVSLASTQNTCPRAVFFYYRGVTSFDVLL
jgi:hypothetical protein